MRNLSVVSVFLGVLIFLFSCGQPDEKVQTEKNTTTKPNLPAPFKKHLKIELGPDIIFDVVAWGRGSDSSSSVLVLRSDSLKNDFTVASSDNLDGHLEEIFNTDMDEDSNPEIVVYYTKNDQYNTAEIVCYEFNDKNVNKISFPDLTSKTEKQYRGNDKFYVKEGKLYRDFDLFSDTDTTTKPTGKIALKYFLKGNRFDLVVLEN